MKIYVLLMGWVMLMSCAEKHVPQENIIAENNNLLEAVNGVVLSTQDIEDVMLVIPEDVKKNIFLNGDKFFDFVITQFTGKQLVEYSLNNNLDKTSEYKALSENYRNRLLSRAAVKHYVYSQNVPDFSDLAYERYLITKTKYIVPEKRKLKHILVKVGKGFHEEKEGRSIAEKILRSLKDGGDFEALAKEKSEDSSGKKGGDLGWVKIGQMVKPFERSAFELEKKNQLSELVKTRFGFHIIKLIEIKPTEQLAFDAVKSKIVAELKLEHEKELESEFLLSYDLQESTKIDKKALSDLYVKLKNKYKN